MFIQLDVTCLVPTIKWFFCFFSKIVCDLLYNFHLLFFDYQDYIQLIWKKKGHIYSNIVIRLLYNLK